MTARHSPLTAAEVIARAGGIPATPGVIALASDDGYGFALVDDNGDGSVAARPGRSGRDDPILAD
jgi:hypothetical protein